MVLVLCILSDEALYLFQFKFHENIAELSHPFLGMGPGPLVLGKIASF